MKEENKANRKGFLENNIIWIILLFFWGVIIFQIAKITLGVIISGILFTIFNLYGCIKLLESKKSKVEGFFIVETIPLVFWLIIAVFQAII